MDTITRKFCEYTLLKINIYTVDRSINQSFTFTGDRLKETGAPGFRYRSRGGVIPTQPTVPGPRAALPVPGGGCLLLGHAALPRLRAAGGPLPTFLRREGVTHRVHCCLVVGRGTDPIPLGTMSKTPLGFCGKGTKLWIVVLFDEVSVTECA